MADLAAASTQQRAASGQEKADAKSKHSKEKDSFKLKLLLWVILMWTCFLLSAVIGRHVITVCERYDNVRQLRIFNIFLIQLPLNIVSGIIIICSDYVRRCLVAPTSSDAHRAERRGRGFLDVGYQSFTNFREAT